ncbi:hypothetical protein B0T26DRAFT_600924, partial [Lasiosphaeria miniovina]
LVLVHGLDGDPDETWRHAATKKSWPEELLPAVRPRTRVLSFGYNGDIFRNDSAAGIRGNARALLMHLGAHRDGADARNRPIVFVAHCLGGLIVKQALCFASREAGLKPIFQAARGVFFFGTPHFRSVKNQWRRIAKDLAPLSRTAGRGRRGKQSSLVDAITRDAVQLTEICEDFADVSQEPLQIVSFYETGHWPGTGSCIVDESSARMGFANEQPVPVDDNHVGICRFNDETDGTFKIMCQQIKKVLG